ACRARSHIQAWASGVIILELPHPSPAFVNRRPHHRTPACSRGTRRDRPNDEAVIPLRFHSPRVWSTALRGPRYEVAALVSPEGIPSPCCFLFHGLADPVVSVEVFLERNGTETALTGLYVIENMVARDGIEPP